MASVKTFGKVDKRSLEQLRRCMEAGEAEFGVLCADHHPGYSQPIGGAVAYRTKRAGRIWVSVHFGSRGFGHRTASGFLNLAQGPPFEGRGREGEMDSPPVLFPVGSELAESYIAAMHLAGAYAHAGRECSRSSAPRRCTRCTTITTTPGPSPTSGATTG